MGGNARGMAGRRAFLAGAGLLGLASLSGCASLPPFSLTEAIRRLLVRA